MKREKDVGFEVRTLSNMIYRQLLAYEARRGIDEVTVMHGWIIGYMYENSDNEIFQKDIESAFSIARSTVTGILKLMEKKGYIYRKSVERDARLKRLVLTDRGRELHEGTVKNIKMLESHVREGIDTGELETFFKVISQMKANLEKESKGEKKEVNHI